MKKIIIGTRGEQPFKITAEGVSGQHASITIFDDGKWILKDLNSTNGTFIRNENAQYEQIDEKRIDEMTVIRLGNDSTINSYVFTAFQVLKEDQDDYSFEFKHLMKQWDVLMEKKEFLEKRIVQLSFAPVLISLGLIGGSCFIPRDLPVMEQMNIMRVIMILPSIVSPIINSYGKKRLKWLTEEIKNTFVCPNPNCGLPLSEAEIKRGQCLKCKKHI